MSAYFDCNATTPIDPEVLEVVLYFLRDEYGNAGSRTHTYGATALKAVQTARREVADVVAADPSEVTFTSGATEANNLAILGLRDFAQAVGRRHIVTNTIEHKAVLEPVQELERQGFEVTWIAPGASGEVSADEILAAVRPDTLLVSVMHANNETGVIQGVGEIAEGLIGSEAYFHVDAAQGFGKDVEPLKNPRIDLISLSGHKLYAPMGIGALIARRRAYKRPPLKPLMLGGGQEGGLRPGTLPVPLIAGLGRAAKLALVQGSKWRQHNQAIARQIVSALGPLGMRVAGVDASRRLPHVINLAIPGVDSEALMLCLKGTVAVSNGSACTSHSYEPSHVLVAMGLDRDWVDGAVRFSWCHLSPVVDWGEVRDAVERLRGPAPR